MIVNSHGDALVNQMPSGEPYFEPEIARYLASAATMQPRLLATIAAKDVRIEDAIDQLELLKTMTRKHGLDNVSLACSLIIQNLKAKVGGDEQD